MLYRLTLVFAIVLVLAASLLASFRSWVETGLEDPMSLPAGGVVLEVEPGNSLNRLARELAGKGYIDSPYPALVYSRLQPLPPIMAGEYRLEAGDSTRDLIEKLVNGDVIRYQVTFPEGRTLEQWLETLNSHEKFAHRSPLDMATVKSEITPPAGESLEGWFFPETYTFSSTDTPLGILRHAHEKMREVLDQEWRNRREGLPLDNPHEALILASIVEKETGLAEERPAIAGVFIRRLEKAMKLQTDPTVIYGLGAAFDGNLTRDHLKGENPYNTYLIPGLPPTPIANPGRDSIRAALNPEEGTALYFVARGDGSHEFSTTLAEHRKAVRQYQLRRAKNYRSAPQ